MTLVCASSGTGKRLFTTDSNVQGCSTSNLLTDVGDMRIQHYALPRAGAYISVAKKKEHWHAKSATDHVFIMHECMHRHCATYSQTRYHKATAPDLMLLHAEKPTQMVFFGQ